MEWREIDGKHALIFDAVPAFLFVSENGEQSFAYDNGRSLCYYDICVKSSAGDPVEYTAHIPVLKR